MKQPRVQTMNFSANLYDRNPKFIVNVACPTKIGRGLRTRMKRGFARIRVEKKTLPDGAFSFPIRANPRGIRGRSPRPILPPNKLHAQIFFHVGVPAAEPALRRLVGVFLDDLDHHLLALDVAALAFGLRIVVQERCST